MMDDLARTNRPTIRVVRGQLGRIVDEIEDALIKADRGLYQRDNKIVSVAYTPAKTNSGEDTTIIQIVERQEHALLVDAANAANFERHDMRRKKFVADDPPSIAIKALREGGRLRLPVLHGVVTAPTMRADGSILSKSGYDDATGLLFEPGRADFPCIPDRPTFEDAKRALATLSELINDFPFIERHDRSVAISAILTAPVRRSLPGAPMHGVTAPTAGTGKGKLVDIACVIATGFRSSPVNLGRDEVELGKNITAKLMEGEGFIAIDNCTYPISGDLLCSMLTSERVSPRILGFSKAPSISSASFVAVNGNNLKIAGDLVRRSLLCRMDAKVEQPENRPFEFDPVEVAIRNRPNLVVAALTILRAYHVAGRPNKLKPLGSFEAWSDLVRSALVWLGEADPVESMNQLRKKDPVLEEARSIMEQWREAFGDRVTVAEVVRYATEMRQSYERAEPAHPDFRDALMAVAGRGNILSGKALGNWLSAQQDKIVDGFKFENMGTRQGVAVWMLKDAREDD